MVVTRKAGVSYPRLPLPEGPDDLIAFQQWLGEAIPMVGSLGITHMAREGDSLVWQLALAPSLNDKGTGFGGALTAQTTLLGWCWVTLWLRERGLARDVVVAESSQQFHAPVTGDYRLMCTPRDPQGPGALAEKLRERGKGRITLDQTLYCGDVICLKATGSYAVLPEA